MKYVFNKESLASTGRLTVILTGLFAGGLFATGGPLLLAPFVAAVLGVTYHLGMSNGMAITSRKQVPSQPKSPQAPKIAGT